MQKLAALREEERRREAVGFYDSSSDSGQDDDPAMMDIRAKAKAIRSKQALAKQVTRRKKKVTTPTLPERARKVCF